VLKYDYHTLATTFQAKPFVKNLVTRMDDVLVEIHKHIARVVTRRYNNFLTTLATACSQHVSRQVPHKCNEVMMEKHRC